ncbi:biopolymer transporter ExbD [Aestuariicella hydrocarbonica]|uniref:Biopolymer transporter ExbD n=1 Tax=Pseudomaricurvus hydrocarbonicus TaxID=1470433 RepID=A0A9E5JUL1_9GAMM|nr:biopolymer transporter ExbD [Aestuariicella hydrocarbonica]NHO64860.1 biopolymer transporter ExbD [Aestuariicella hydrocarbonica]
MSRARRASFVAAAASAPGNDDNMMPLINIVFLLLIFFMVAGHISRLSEGELDLPSTVTERSADAESLVLQMNLRQQLLLDSEVVELTKLERALGSSPQMTAALERHGLALQVDKSVTAQELAPVLSKLRQMGVKSVQLHALLDMDAAP